MGVVGAAVVAFVAAQFLEAYPNVGLDVFDHVAEVDAAVGIRQCGSDKDFACHGLCFGKQWIKMSGIIPQNNTQRLSETRLPVFQTAF